GDWTTHTVGTMDHQLRVLEARSDVASLYLDLSAIRNFDTAGAWLIARLVALQEKRGAQVELTGQSEATSILLKAVSETAEEPIVPANEARKFNPLAFFEMLGRGMYLL